MDEFVSRPQRALEENGTDTAVSLIVGAAVIDRHRNFDFLRIFERPFLDVESNRIVSYVGMKFIANPFPA